MTSIGVVGLGAMGGAIAVRLVQSGFEVQGYDISQPAIDRFISAGGRASSDLQAATDKQIVITSLPNDDILWSVIRSGLITKLRPDQTFIEMSTISPSTMIDVARALKGIVREIVDAPVSGGPNEAKLGRLNIFVGVEGQLQPQTHDLLLKLGSVNLLGQIGNGKSLKLVNNMMALGASAVAMEAFQLGVELGLDSEAMYTVLSKSGAGSTVFNKRGTYVLKDDFTARFAVYLAEKDLGLTLKMAHNQQYPTPLLANVHQRYESAMAQGLGQEDIAALIKLYRR
jgi:3-hydroxyisobutyrate dehydrogenase-like beta-hydroxyacid dehydrogenase